VTYPGTISLSTAHLTHLSDLLRGHRAAIGSRWRKLTVGQQAMQVLAHLRNGDTYARLAAGFGGRDHHVPLLRLLSPDHRRVQAVEARTPEHASSAVRGRERVPGGHRAGDDRFQVGAAGAVAGLYG
jgi:hypothetical protein